MLGGRLRSSVVFTFRTATDSYLLDDGKLSSRSPSIVVCHSKYMNNFYFTGWILSQDVCLYSWLFFSFWQGNTGMFLNHGHYKSMHKWFQSFDTNYDAWILWHIHYSNQLKCMLTVASCW